jgi:hypothetical protein
VPLTAFLWLVVFGGLALRAVRGLAWWPIVAVVTIARITAGPTGAAPAEPSTPRTVRRLNVVLASFVVVAGIILLPVWRPFDPALQAPVGVVGSAPAGITRHLRELVGPADRMFAPQRWGSWFEFAVPQAPLFVDSRIEIFPLDVWADYDRVDGARDGWQETLDRWAVTVVVVTTAGGDALAARMATDPGWRQVLADDDGWIFVRSGRPG